MKLNLVPAGAGFGWAVLGIKTFFRQPLALGGLFLMFLGLLAVISLLPYVGAVLALAILPAATLGLMQASQLAEQGQFPMPSVLLAALSAAPERRRQMAYLGGSYAIGFLLIMAATTLADGGQFASLYLLGGEITPELMQNANFQLASWLSLLLYLPLSLMFWHAPALVHWHGLGAIQSLFYSFLACLKNFWALALFGAIWLLLMLALLMLITVFAALLGNPKIVTLALVPLTLAVLALFFFSLYFTYQGSFIADESPPQESPP